MNKISKFPSKKIQSNEPLAVHLTTSEIQQLKSLLKILRYDDVQDAFIIEHGKSRILARADGTIRIEGEKVTNASQGELRLNGAVVEIN